METNMKEITDAIGKARNYDMLDVKIIKEIKSIFSHGTLDEMTEVANAFIPLGGNEIFPQNARNFAQSLLTAIVEKRDKQGMPFSLDVLRSNMSLDNCIEIIEDETLSNATRNTMCTFLSSLGYQEKIPRDEQPKSLPEHFGYARSYFGQPLLFFIDTCRSI